MERTIQHVIDEQIKRHPVEDNNLIKERISKAYRLLIDIINKKGISDTDKPKHIIRALEVSYTMSIWGLDYQIIIAGLLHELPVNNICSIEDLKSEITPRSYTIINKYMTLNTILITHNNAIDPNIIKSSYKEAFYIEAAFRIYSLSGEYYDYERKALCVQNTKNNLIPLVKEIHAYKIANEMEEACFRIEHKDEYRIIDNVYNDWECKTWKYRQEFLRNLTKQIKTSEEDKDVSSFATYYKKLYTRPRYRYSIYGFVTAINKRSDSLTKLNEDLKKVNNYYRVAFKDVLVVVDDATTKESNLTLTHIFLRYYDETLRVKGMYIYGYYFSNEDNCNYFLISDSMKNMYRVFLKNETEYKQYNYGDILTDDTIGGYIPKVSDEKIKVYDSNGIPIMIEKGASVLDFAFNVREDYGLYFQSAYLNHNHNLALPVSTVLHYGDTVEVIKNDLQPTASIQWFRYIKTEKAINVLIRYFKDKLEVSDDKIMVITLNGSSIQVNKGLTVLDYAFLVHRDLGLHFDYAQINHRPNRVSVDYVLQNFDEVIIQKSDMIKANYNWFKHVTTKKAIETLIEHFKAREKENK